MMRYETWAKELRGKRIRIVAGPDPLQPFLFLIDTNTPILNCTRFSIDARAGGYIQATLWLAHVEPPEIHEEAFVTEHLECDLIALVQHPEAVEDFTFPDWLPPLDMDYHNLYSQQVEWLKEHPNYEEQS